MREMEFKMERSGLIEEGQEAEVTELQALGGYSYLIGNEWALQKLGSFKIQKRHHKRN